MQFRVFVPDCWEGRIVYAEEIYSPIGMRIKGGGFAAAYAPLRQYGVRSCVVVDLKPHRADDINPGYLDRLWIELGIEKLDRTFGMDLADFRALRFVGALDIGREDNRLVQLKERLMQKGSGEIFVARYPVVKARDKEDVHASMFVLEGRGDPETTGEILERRLRELYGDRFAFSEEEKIDEF